MPKTRQPDPLTPTRQKALRAFCRRKAWLTEDDKGEIVSVDLQSIHNHFDGKKSKNKLSDLIHGRGSFGAPMARELESASKGELQPFELDGLEGVIWPFSSELGKKVVALQDDDLWFAENALRSHLKMDPLPRPKLGGSIDQEAA